MYPGGAPTSRATECRSMNSDMSILTIASSLPNMNSASARTSSVLPTPVGPRKVKEPIGRRGSFRPARARDRLLAGLLRLPAAFQLLELLAELGFLVAVLGSQLVLLGRDGRLLFTLDGLQMAHHVLEVGRRAGALH